MNAYRKLGERDPERFWAKMAREHVSWFSPWKRVLDWKPPFAKWFVGGKLNVSYNCLDRHLEGKHAGAATRRRSSGRASRATRACSPTASCTARSAASRTCCSAHGVSKGDRVAVYMPMIPELAIAMLACARIGAPHRVVFGGFSAEALRDRINDAGAKLVVTADGGYRRGAAHALKPAVDEALEGAPCVQKVICVQANRLAGRDARGARRLVARRDAGRERRLPARQARQRASALHPLHQRHHRQAEGRAAHDRRLPHPRGHHRQGDLRPEGRRHLLVYGRSRLGHRAIPTSSTGSSPTARPR